MYRDGCRRDSDKLGGILKAVVGAGLVIVTLAMIFLLNDTLSRSAASWQAQMAVAGCVILVMGFLSLRLFQRL